VIDAAVVTLISVGNPYRRDDGVGAAVLTAVGEALGSDPRVRLVELDGEPVRMMQAWEGSPTVWIVDATSSDRRPGTLHELDARRLGEVGGSWRGVGGGHAFGLREAIEFATGLDRLPAEIRVLGIEGETFDHGEGLAPAVAAAVPVAAARLVSAIRAALATSGRDDHSM
jgi:hydrogenase maturation protease